jgi:hypothetical protein
MSHLPTQLLVENGLLLSGMCDTTFQRSQLRSLISIKVPVAGSEPHLSYPNLELPIRLHLITMHSTHMHSFLETTGALLYTLSRYPKI